MHPYCILVGKPRRFDDEERPTENSAIPSSGDSRGAHRDRHVFSFQSVPTGCCSNAFPEHALPLQTPQNPISELAAPQQRSYVEPGWGGRLPHGSEESGGGVEEEIGVPELNETNCVARSPPFPSVQSPLANFMHAITLPKVYQTPQRPTRKRLAVSVLQAFRNPSSKGPVSLHIV